MRKTYPAHSAGQYQQKIDAETIGMISASILVYREDRIRTCDPLVPNQVLYQAELLPEVFC